ncbi:MAG: hypothetical protein ACM3PY_10210 [Omnitrophica WOR_2 bacterium]
MNTQLLLVIVVLVVIGWFAAGIILNLRKGDSLLKWMEGGLPLIGQRTSFRWLGSSVAELVISKAKPPFRRCEILAVLEPRDVPWIWLLSRINGRRDTLIIRAHLPSPPALEFDLADPHSWTGRLAIKQDRQQGWENRLYRGKQLMAPNGNLDLSCEMLDRLSDPLTQISEPCWRFSLRHEPPHLELHLPLPNRHSIQSGDFFKALQDFGRLLAAREPKAP